MGSNALSLTAVSLLAAVMMTASAGCKDTGPGNEAFFSHNECSDLKAAYAAQAAAGARHDAMLLEQHFDGPALNGLGRAKLDAMLAQPGPLTVYVNAHGPTFQSRRHAVLAYAREHGRDEQLVRVEDGINPGTLHPASPDAARVGKTELGGSPSGGAAAPDQAAGNSTWSGADTGLSGNTAPGSASSTGKQGG